MTLPLTEYESKLIQLFSTQLSSWSSNSATNYVDFLSLKWKRFLDARRICPCPNLAFTTSSPSTRIVANPYCTSPINDLTFIWRRRPFYRNKSNNHSVAPLLVLLPRRRRRIRSMWSSSAPESSDWQSLVSYCWRLICPLLLLIRPFLAPAPPAQVDSIVGL